MGDTLLQITLLDKMPSNAPDSCDTGIGNNFTKPNFPLVYIDGDISVSYKIKKIKDLFLTFELVPSNNELADPIIKGEIFVKKDEMEKFVLEETNDKIDLTQELLDDIIRNMCHPDAIRDIGGYKKHKLSGNNSRRKTMSDNRKSKKSKHNKFRKTYRRHPHFRTPNMPRKKSKCR